MFKPKYKLTNKILASLTSIAETRVVIEKAKILPAQELKLRRQALIRMTHSSTAIEGNILDIHQVEAIVRGKKIDAPSRDIHEIKNYLGTIRYIEKLVKDKKVINEKIILKIHQLVTDKTLPKEHCGKYRDDKVYVVRRRLGLPDEIVYTGPQAKNVPHLMKELINWIYRSDKTNMHPIIIAGIVHREIAAIHPFFDGNGRVARALATLILYQRGYDFRRLFALEDYYNRDRNEYYKHINIGPTYKKTGFTEWLEYFIEGFKKEIIQARKKILSLPVTKISKKLKTQVYLNERQLQIIDFINTIGKITIKDAIDILRCPKRTAQLELQKLKKMGIIKQIGKGPATAYALK